MSKHFTHAIVHTLLVGLIAGAGMTPSNAFADAEPKVLGKTIGEWSAEWWQWAFAIPTTTNPQLGGDCAQGQQGPVWFLAGVWMGGTEGHPAKADRSCNVPRGKYIFFPIANSFWLNSAQDDPHTETEYRKFANDELPPSIGGELEATLDGNPIIFNPETPIIRSQSPVFTASFPPVNVITTSFRVPASDLTGYPIVSDGFWVILPPLSPGDHNGEDPGDHTLHFRAGPTDDLKQDVTYYLTVGKP
jgi:hypothetical protein